MLGILAETLKTATQAGHRRSAKPLADRRRRAPLRPGRATPCLRKPTRPILGRDAW
ncbi:MAG: hypothetical protein HLUCCA08_03260 [Rhodobacteraceae bacterium HLUCCA08]|nr:MAG: hypothetical protein HLUCCA08_03260 [Rhodobacteraceae bacterium HLUCCA08]